MQIKVIKLSNGKRRIVHGEYAEIFDLDYTQSLTELKKDIEFSLLVFRRKYEKKGIFNFNKKDIKVHQGSSHLDIIDNGVGSTNWLTIEDHEISD